MPLFSFISAKLGHFFVCNEMLRQVATFTNRGENRKCCFGGVVSVGTGRDLSVHNRDNNPDNYPNNHPDNHPNNNPDNRE